MRDPCSDGIFLYVNILVVNHIKGLHNVTIGGYWVNGVLYLDLQLFRN